MSSEKVPIRRDFTVAHSAQNYRWFRCTGKCGTEIIAIAEAWLACGQPGCRGQMKPSNRISSSRLAKEQFEAARDHGAKSRLTPRFLGVLASERPWNSHSDGYDYEGVLRGLIGGIAVAQEMVIQALIDGSDGEWQWAPGTGRCDD